MSVLQSNRLAVLAKKVADAHASCHANARSAAENAIEAGNLLLEAKAALRHGQWLPWLRDHVGISERSAQQYMRLARAGLKPETVSDLGLRAALATTATKRIPIPGPGQFLCAEEDVDPDILGSQTAFVWPSRTANFLHAVLVASQAGMGHPHHVVGTSKPFASNALRDILRAAGFPINCATFDIYPATGPGGRGDTCATLDRLRLFAVDGKSRLFGEARA